MRFGKIGLILTPFLVSAGEYAGDMIIEVVNTRHKGINTSSSPVKLVIFYTGAKDIPNVLIKTTPK